MALYRSFISVDVREVHEMADQSGTPYTWHGWRLVLNGHISVDFGSATRLKFLGCKNEASGELRLPCRFDTQWHTYSLHLHENAGWVRVADGRATTSREGVALSKGQLMSTLQYLDTVELHPIYRPHYDQDTTGVGYAVMMDNVVIGGFPRISAVEVTGANQDALAPPGIGENTPPLNEESSVVLRCDEWRTNE